MNRYFRAVKNHELWKLRSLYIYSAFINDYREYRNPVDIFVTHRRGFTMGDWKVLGLNKLNYKSYLSSKEYASLHPINGAYSSWIDDKLTLKYLCAGTKLDEYLPDYYYMIDKNGVVSCLMNVKECGTATVQDVVTLLIEKKELAIKRIAGAIGAGFYHVVSLSSEAFLLNAQKIDKSELVSVLATLRNYLVTEYLHPCEYLSHFWPNTTNTFRYLEGKINNEMRFINAFIRFGSSKSGEVENYNVGGILCPINAEGYFDHGNILDFSSHNNNQISIHPDTGLKLNGMIPQWDEVLKVVNLFNMYFPMFNYLGFDFVIAAGDKVKIIEINSQTSLDTFQIEDSVYNSAGGEFFRERLIGV